VDRVIVSSGDPAAGLRVFLESWHQRWPDMRTAVDGILASEFFRWCDVRPELPSKTGEVLVARDPGMDEDWGNHGCRLGVDGEGPFHLLYRPAPRQSLRMLALQDLYQHGHPVRFDPYEVQLVGTRISLITVVLPDDEGTFGDEVLDAVVRGLNQADSRTSLEMGG
jgi:hypothetical protein